MTRTVGPLRAIGFEEPAPGGEGLLLLGRRGHRLEPDEGAEAVLDPVAERRVGLGQHAVELRRHGGLVVGLEDPGVGLDDLAERPEAGPVAVREAAAEAPRDEIRQGLDVPRQLADEAALAEAGIGDDRRHLERRGRPSAIEERHEEGKLDRAADEWGRLRAELTCPAGDRPPRPPEGDGIGLALRGDGRQLLVAKEVSRRPVGGLAHDHRVHRRRRLEAGGGVHDVAGHGVVAFAARSRRVEDLAGVDPQPQVELEPERGDPFEDPEGRPDSSFRVVLVGDRRTEEGHHAVAQEPVDEAAVTRDLRRQDVVVGDQEGPHVLRVERLGAGGEAGEVAEQDRDELAFLENRYRPGEGRPGEGCGTCATEPEAVRVRGATGRAGRHDGERTSNAGRGQGPPDRGQRAVWPNTAWHVTFPMARGTPRPHRPSCPRAQG